PKNRRDGVGITRDFGPKLGRNRSQRAVTQPVVRDLELHAASTKFGQDLVSVRHDPTSPRGASPHSSSGCWLGSRAGSLRLSRLSRLSRAAFSRLGAGRPLGTV